jgi:hypothetical protein
MRGGPCAWTLVALLLAPFSAAGQTGLRDLATNFLRNGITLAPPPPGVVVSHEAHFIDVNSEQFLAVRAFNQELAAQLASFPLASSAGGFTYRYDPTLGTFTRATQSFGPIYTERADTIGKNKVNMGVNYSNFSFDRIDDLSLKDGDAKLVFTHKNVASYVKGDVITGTLKMDVSADVVAFVMTYGLLDRLDIGAAVPIEKIRLSATTDAVIERLSTQDNTTIHRFTDGSSRTTLQASGSATGVGDILLRTKYQLVQGKAGGGLSIATDVRFPTGEERDLLGTGTWRVGGFLIGSLQLGAFSPHINAGYTWSSNPPDDRTPEDINPPGGGPPVPPPNVPDMVSYAGGFDWAVHPRVTIVVDILGRTFLNSQRVSVVDQTYTAQTGDSLGGACLCEPEGENPPRTVTATYPRLTSTEGDVNTLQGSIGIKFNPWANLLVTANVLFSLNRQGLQDSFSPLVALDYSF